MRNRVRGMVVMGLCVVSLRFANAADSAAATPVREVRVAAAASMTHAMAELVRQFQGKEPGIRITPVYGASGSLYAQVANKAPYDLFLSADTEYPARLVKDGLGVRESLFVYARGRLVLWAATNVLPGVTSLGLATLRDERIRKIAIANPKLAPYGRAAEDAMKKAGVYEEVKAKLVFAENVAQAATFAHTGAADVAIIPASLAVVPAMKEKGRYSEVPLDGVGPIEQATVLLTNAAQPDAARAFLGFLKSPEGVRILESFGFSAPGGK